MSETVHDAKSLLAEAGDLMRESIAVYNSWHAEQPDGAVWWQRMADAQSAMRAFLDRVVPLTDEEIGHG